MTSENQRIKEMVDGLPEKLKKIHEEIEHLDEYYEKNRLIYENEIKKRREKCPHIFSPGPCESRVTYCIVCGEKRSICPHCGQVENK